MLKWIAECYADPKSIICEQIRAMSITFGKYAFFVIVIVRFIIHLVYISLKLVRDKRVELLALAESKRCSTTELITH